MKKDMVAGLIIENKKILLVHNTKYNGLRIEPPGGKKQPDENWEHAVLREIKEELGILVSVSGVFGVYDTNSPEGEFSVRMFFCKIEQGKPTIKEPEKISNFAWYSLEELKKLKHSGRLVPNLVNSLPELGKFL